MLPTGNRTGSVKMMSIRTGKLVTRDQFKLLPMPSTVIDRLNERAAREGKKIGIRSNMVYSVERGLNKNVTYIQPTADLAAPTVHPVERYDDNSIGQLADTNIDFNTDIEPQQESYSAEEIENDIQDMDAQVNSPLRQIEFNTNDLNVGQLVEFDEPVIEAFNHRDASVSVTPLRSGGCQRTDE